PLPETNRPGLNQIRYRAGTYASFLTTMLERIGSVTVPDAVRPLASLTTRASDDPAIALLDLWAYVGDILTFYQERFANEAFLRTAREEQSVTWLAALLGYRPAPGAAAQTYVAFTLEPGKSVEIPVGLRVQSVPGQHEEPQKFETVETLPAVAALNAMGLKTTRPLALSNTTQHLVLVGTNLGLVPGNYLLVVGDERLGNPDSERWDVRRIDAVSVDGARGTTRVEWNEPLGGGSAVPEPPTNAKAYVFREQAWPFGYNAPLFSLVGGVLGEIASWEDDALGSPLDLDNLYKRVARGDFFALVSPGRPRSTSGGSFPPYVELYRASDVVDTVRSGYTLSSKVTRITPDTSVHLDLFPVRGTQILLRPEELTIAEEPLTSPLEGDELVLDGLFPDVTPRRTLIVTGTDAAGNARSEVVVVRGASLDAGASTTTLELALALAASYVRTSVQVLGNVAFATHGETVRDETLGDGDATAVFQDFSLSRKPVTFVHDGTAPHGVRSTLALSVAGVLWQEDEELFDHGPTDSVYVTRRDVAGTLHAEFGDGVTGARLPTGNGNVVVSYRRGLGLAGNVRAGTLTTLLDRPPGLRSATNPAPADGGDDADPPELTRENTPNGVRTLGRIVSLRDFEDAAREVAGVRYARATAGVVAPTFEPQVDLTVLGAGGAALSQQTLASVATYLAARRDGNRRLRLALGTAVPVRIALRCWLDPRYDPDAVMLAARARLSAWIGSLGLGEGLHTSRAYAVLADLPGLTASLVESFARRSGTPPPGPVLVIQPNELALLEHPETDVVVTRVSA
ncbi:MAG TPA: baseplate J/gp47 family protein, partial [Polyangiaceae bacterium]|nr:baseplate J/gp47 family protein [Polyangiaceae bacterium]